MRSLNYPRPIGGCAYRAWRTLHASTRAPKLSEGRRAKTSRYVRCFFSLDFVLERPRRGVKRSHLGTAMSLACGDRFRSAQYRVMAFGANLLKHFLYDRKTRACRQLQKCGVAVVLQQMRCDALDSTVFDCLTQNMQSQHAADHPKMTQVCQDIRDRALILNGRISLGKFQTKFKFRPRTCFQCSNALTFINFSNLHGCGLESWRLLRASACR